MGTITAEELSKVIERAKWEANAAVLQRGGTIKTLSSLKIATIILEYLKDKQIIP
jgi:hypothetical protein